MVLVPAGEFLMGSKEGQGFEGEFPQRKVTLDDYYIYKYLVTVAEYRRFCQETGRAMPPHWKSCARSPACACVAWRILGRRAANPSRVLSALPTQNRI